MSKYLTVITVLLLLLLVAVNGVMAAPRLLIKESSFDFGYAPQNSKVSHKFWLYSTGDDTLKILKVVPG